MAKPVFNPVQYELRNQLPLAVSEEQATAIEQETSRVNEQLAWVAQMLGWSGPNYWTNLPLTVHQKRALLGGTYGVYNSYTLLPLKEIRTWEQRVLTEKKPNIAIGQRVIIGDQQTFIYNLEESEDSLALDLGPLSDTVIGYLQSGAAIKVDCPQNRPFPFYRPTPEASADAYFRCSLGETTQENDFYRYSRLILSPFSQNNTLLPYENLWLFAGSYYYFDRAVYVSQGTDNLAPWFESEWVESAGLWQIYIPTEVIGNQYAIVWDYAEGGTSKRILATARFQVVEWHDPSDWGEGGSSFNPVLDEYVISKTYDTAGLNYSLGTRLFLGDNPPQNENPLWYDAGLNSVYAYQGNQWNKVGVIGDAVLLTGASAPPPTNYEFRPGSIWQDPQGQAYIWDAGFVSYDFFYFFPNGIINGFFYIDPSSQNVQGLYLYDPDNFLVHYPNYVDPLGLVIYNCTEDEDGFYINSPNFVSPNWYKVDFFSQDSFTSTWTPSYSSNLYVLVDGEEIPAIWKTSDYEVVWGFEGQFLSVTYRALTEQGEFFVPRITIGSFNGVSTDYIDISSDFTSRPTEVTTIPYSEIGPLNNFRGAWGNKGGARSMDFAFDALDIHGYSEQQALMLRPVHQTVDFDDLLALVSGSRVFIGDAPPPAANVGDYYWNNETGSLAVYYVDRDRNKIWVEIDYPISPCLIGNPECDYFPIKPILSTGSCFLTNGNTWQDPDGPAATIWYDSPNNFSAWVELNWNMETGQGWQATQTPSLIPDFSVLDVLITEEMIPVSVGEVYTTASYRFSYTWDEVACTWTFNYEALSPEGVQILPQVYLATNRGDYPPVSIYDLIFSNAEWYLGPAVQNSEWTLRPWKTQSLEVTSEEELYTDTYFNPLTADTNLGPGDGNWSRSFIRLPSEYSRESTVWNQTRLVMQDFAYFGTQGTLKDMRCPTQDSRPQIYEQLVFLRQDAEQGAVIFSAPFWFSDVEGFNNLVAYYPNRESTSDGYLNADFDFVTDSSDGVWEDADLSNYDPLHNRRAFDDGTWDGLYTETANTRPLSGYLERDLRVKTLVPVPPPVWDASIYKYAPLCPQGPESYEEDPNNFKVNYAYFAADLGAAEDGFFDQSQDVAWREPLEEDQTLYILNT